MPTTLKGLCLLNKHTEINKCTTGSGGVWFAQAAAGPGPGRGSEGTCLRQMCISGPDRRRPRPNDFHSLVIRHSTTSSDRALLLWERHSTQLWEQLISPSPRANMAVTHWSVPTECPAMGQALNTARHNSAAPAARSALC